MSITLVSSSITLPSSSSVCLAVDTSTGGWAFGSPEDAHFFFEAEIEFTGDASPPPSVATGSEWQVGFIQNVVSEIMNLTYDGMAPISLAERQRCLDASPSSQPWIHGAVRDVLHYGNVRGFDSVLFSGRPVRVRIAMADWPRFAVYNFFGGGSLSTSHGAQIRSIENTRHFQTWIAARNATSPANMVSSYTLLGMVDFAIQTRITLGTGGPNPLFRREYEAAQAGTSGPSPAFTTLDVHVEYGAMVGRTNQFAEGELAWGPPPSGDQPVVVPPLANDHYPAQSHQRNDQVAPRSLSLMTVRRCV
jgi:hypothetical protein